MKWKIWSMILGASVLLGNQAQAQDPAVVGAPLVPLTQPTAPGFTVLGGFGIYILQPAFSTNPAYAKETFNNNNGNRSTTQVDFTYGMDVAPMAWVGFTNEDGFGFRARYFQYAQGSTATINGANDNAAYVLASPLGIEDFPFPLPAGKSAYITSSLNVLAWDFEAVQSLTSGPWQFIGAAGVRYAHLSQNYNGKVSTTEDFGEGGIADFAFNQFGGHSFNGAGPTIALDSKRFLFGTGLGVYANARVSMLFGTQKEYANYSETGDFGDFTEEAQTRAFRVIPVTELELGVEYGQTVGMFRFFGQVGFLAQCWWNAGNASNNNVMASDDLFFSPDNNGDMGFLGIALRAGVGF